MSTLPKILVTSAAGKTGLPVTLQLLERGFPVRAFVREGDARSMALEKAGAEIYIGDQYCLRDMREAMTGIRRAYQCAPTAPNGLHFNAVFTAAVVEARVEHVVTLGQWLSSADHPSFFTREVYLSDILIRVPAGLSVTSVNPGWFADNYLMVLEMAAHLGIFAMPLGDGRIKKNAPPSNADIASVAVAALCDPEKHAGKAYRPTGPELSSPDDVAQAMGRALGRKVRYVDISEAMMTKALRAFPPSNYSEAAVSQLAIYAEEYRRGSFAVNAPTGDVELVGGRSPESFESVVKQAVEKRPDLRTNLLRQAGGLAAFAKVLLTPSLNLKKVETVRDHVLIKAPRFCQETTDWMATHSSHSLAARPDLTSELNVSA
ncbi:MAG: NmrA family NAD(P)-binding protein [Roseibium sp.]|uniref:NmrA family NAD(P)-binding protein n=1 Tax=Roseibium sp. TaxID=1936156 RepID=UPI0026339C7F|nr:NmrA family NAD(P)-binding protein [Roseibium sp.]MCV0429927.1 NmrA family NAD(P)-binding protein [Roseibium sp.]